MQHASNVTHLHKIAGRQQPVSGREVKPKLLDQLREALRSHHYSRRTEQAYCHINMLPASPNAHLQKHLKRIKATHEKDLADGWGRVLMPDAIDRKYPNAQKEWRWRRIFPQENCWRITKAGEEGRHYKDDSLVQEAVREAVTIAALIKRATCHEVRILCGSI
jgi:hypothetical protein